MKSKARHLASMAIVLMLSSCLTTNRAQHRLDKIQSAHPELIADFARSKFPCITTPVSIDTVYTDTPEVPIFIDTVMVPCNGQDSAICLQVTHRTIRTLTITKTIRIRDVADSMRTVTVTNSLVKVERNADRWQTVAWVFIGLFLLAIVSFIIYIKIRN